MVSNVTSLTGNGFKDWLIQRVSAVILGAYTIFLCVYFVKTPEISYQSWQALFHCPFFKIATVITLLSLLMHAWIGMWTVYTDYLKCVCIRLPVQILSILVLFGYFIWGLMIIWGV